MPELINLGERRINDINFLLIHSTKWYNKYWDSDMKKFTQKFKVDDFIYELSIKNNEICVALIGGKNHKTTYYQLAYDPFARFEDWGNGVDYDVNADINAWKFLSELKKSIEQWFYSNRPKFFTITAYSARKRRIYEWLLRKYLKDWMVCVCGDRIYSYCRN
jgi:hypothetical protein